MATLKARSNPIVNNGGFNHKYICPKSIVQTMTDALMNKTWIEDAGYLFSNVSECFVSLRAYPFDVTKWFWGNMTPPIEKIRLGKNIVKLGNTTHYGYVMPYGNFYKHIGTFVINGEYGNFIDYSPYTKLEIYIPFCGFLTLDTNLVMNHEIRLFMAVDFDSGSCTCYVVRMHTDYESDNDSDVIESINGQIGFDIPLGSSNANENAKKMLTTGLSIAGGVIASYFSANPTPLLISTGINGATNMFNANQQHISKGCAPSGSQALVTPTKAYLIKTTIIPTCTQQSYAHTKGIPLNEMKTLNQLSGFTQVSECHLDGFESATSSELDEIYSLLTGGVIL